MEEFIKEQYDNLIMNNADFRAFVENMEKYSTDEIEAMYGLKFNVISCLAGLSKRPA